MVFINTYFSWTIPKKWGENVNSSKNIDNR